VPIVKLALENLCIEILEYPAGVAFVADLWDQINMLFAVDIWKNTRVVQRPGPFQERFARANDESGTIQHAFTGRR
jgi:hypothetical protein